MSQIIINGQPLYQVDLPEMTMAEYLALPVAERPKEWIRTDGSPCLYYENDMMPATYPASRVSHESVSVTADGVKTYGQLLNELFALTDATKVECGKTYIKLQETSGYDSFMPLCLLDHNEPSYMFIGEQYYNKSSNTIETYKWLVRSSNSYIVKNSTDATSQIPASGEIISIYY